MARRRSDSEELDHSLKQVDDLLNESISLSRSLTLDLCPPILHDVGFVAGLEWLARFVGERHQLDVQVDIAPDAELEDQEMRVVVFEAARELLFNVVKHAHVPQARLTAERTADDQIRLTVSDDGYGFEPEKLDFGAAEGFGLFNIRQRLELMGGRLEVESAPGEGARITILAPANAPSPPEDDLLTDSLLHPLISQRRRPGTEEGTATTVAARIRVLLADDHEIVREGLASLLLEEPDMEIVGEAKDGVEAVELAATMHPDVILMDVTMPRLDGIEATRQIKARLPEVHVIGLSMHEEEDLARAMRQAGAAAYMSKNGCSDALVTAIRNEMTP
jgi:CheY-like chemotaxis protein